MTNNHQLLFDRIINTNCKTTIGWKSCVFYGGQLNLITFMKIINYYLIAGLFDLDAASTLITELIFKENLSARILELEVSANQKRYRKSEKEKLVTQKKLSLRNCIDR